MNPTKQTFYPGLRYRDARAAIRWLREAFGFEEDYVVSGDGEQIAHAQLVFNGSRIMLGSVRDDDDWNKTPKEAGLATGGVYVALDDAAAIDALFARAVAAGAEVVRSVQDTEYGSHEFSVRDIEGYPWGFGTYRP